MARYLYGASGAAAVVGPSGVPVVASANTMSARTGGVAVTDVQTPGGTPLAGVVTPNANGQFAFLGPDGYVTPIWLDFGSGDRWAVHPVDISGQITASYVAAQTAENASPGAHTAKANLPYTANRATAGLAAALDPLVVPRFSTQAARDAAFPSPTSGDRCFRTDINANQTYNSTAARWVSQNSLIQEITTTVATNSVTFSNIPGDWQNLRLMVSARSTETGASAIFAPLKMIFNGDGGATSYTYAGEARGRRSGVSNGYLMDIPNSTTGVTSTTAATAADIQPVNPSLVFTTGMRPLYMPSSTTTSSTFGGGEIQIPNYAQTTNKKTVLGQGGWVTSTGTVFNCVYQITGAWNSTAAVTSITLTNFGVGGGTFAVGSKFALFGEG